MTIEKLCGLSADEMEAMTPEDLVREFAEYLPLTRPQKVVVIEAKKTKAKKKLSNSVLLEQAKVDRLKHLAEQFGLPFTPPT
jgi:N-glycosylase/DNA lyase